MGTTEVAAHLGVGGQRVFQLAAKGDLPAPSAVLSSGKI